MNRIIFILLLLFLTRPVFANPEPVVSPMEPLSIEQQNVQVEPEPLQDDSISTTPSAGNIEQNSVKEPYNKSDLKKQIVPETKGELFRVAFMFIKVMFAVVLCSIIIFLLLLFVRKNYADPLPRNSQDENNSNDLKSAQNENEALKAFFNQTKNH